MKVLVFGYSDSPDRYSHMAHELLLACGHDSIPLNPRHEEELERFKISFDTLTMYVSKKISDKFARDILNSSAKRVIFNPGAENEELEKKLQDKGVETLHACTLVMLKTNQF